MLVPVDGAEQEQQKTVKAKRIINKDFFAIFAPSFSLIIPKLGGGRKRGAAPASEPHLTELLFVVLNLNLNGCDNKRAFLSGQYQVLMRPAMKFVEAIVRNIGVTIASIN